jgi:hypothetical protein
LLVAHAHVFVPRVDWLLPAGRSGPQPLKHEGVVPDVHGVVLSCRPEAHALTAPPSPVLPLLPPLLLAAPPLLLAVPPLLAVPLLAPLLPVPELAPPLDPLPDPLATPLELGPPELPDWPGLSLLPHPAAIAPAATRIPPQSDVNA